MMIDDLTITPSGYRVRHSPSPCHRVPAATVASLHEPKPNAVLSFSSVFHKVSFGLPRILLPSGAHVDFLISIASTAVFPIR